MPWFALLMLPLLLSPPAGAVLIDTCDGLENTSAPPVDPGWDWVGTNSGTTLVYLGNGWVITAAHTVFQDAQIGGTTYPKVDGSWTQIQNADLAVYQIDPAPPLGLLPIRPSSDPIAPTEDVIMVGFGLNRGAATSWMGIDGYDWGVGSIFRWGTNRVWQTGFDVITPGRTTRSFALEFNEIIGGAPDNRCDPVFKSQLTCPPDTNQHECPEAIAVVGDSGGAVFTEGSGDWELSGIMFNVGTPYANHPADTALYGDYTLSSDLAFYHDDIIAIVRPECSNGLDDDGDLLFDLDDPGCLFLEDDSETPDCDGVDADGDLVGDVCDNCLLVQNPGQTDADGDLYGNACDGDLDQTGVTTIFDFNLLRGCMGQVAGEGSGPAQDPTCSESDMDESGVVTVSDFNLWKAEYQTPPGPSGLVP